LNRGSSEDGGAAEYGVAVADLDTEDRFAP
jgi:hypothetical protein